MAQEQRTNKAARLLYRPLGMAGSIVGGLVASFVFKKVWQQAAPGQKPDPPKPLESEYPLRQVVLAAVVQGAIYSLVKTLIDRGGARLFERWTGEWPGD